ncbi:multidrug resistance protein NorM [Devosia pacifica]|uniref:Multidrug-efflux transporter n=1 Tax=Devosia pacifica TaxID=1335967 RepID=A0A918S096_9HYPH|nr:MATE family efflux transporter [Devosia pacifica]GHA15703.1 multidrug resistance protein NorM [Devosia pacifica]
MTEQDFTVTQGAAPHRAAAPSWQDELKATLLLAWPLVIAQLAQNALHVTDVIMLGWLGSDFLAAGTLATAVLTPVLLLGIGTVSAVAPLVAQARGARNIKGIRRVVRQGFWVSIAASALIIPLLLQIELFFTVTGQDPLATERAGQYMQIAAFSVLPALGIMTLRSLLSAFDTTRIILWITVAGVFFNAAVNYLLIFGNFGAPRLELRGAAVATLTTNLLMFALMLLFVLRHRRFKRFNILVRFWRPDWSRFWQIVRIGVPIGFTLLAEVGMFTAAALFMGWLGTDEVAAHAVALQCASTAFMVPLGLGMASTVRVGVGYGAKDRDAVARAGWVAMALGTGFMAFSAALFIAFSGVFVRLFLDPNQASNTEALALAATYLVVAGLFQIVDGAQVIAAHALRGLNDTTVPMLAAIIGYWFIGLPTAYALGFVADLEGVGIWLGLAVGLSAVAIVLTWRFAWRERLGLLRGIPA